MRKILIHRRSFFRQRFELFLAQSSVKDYSEVIYKKNKMGLSNGTADFLSEMRHT